MGTLTNNYNTPKCKYQHTNNAVGSQQILNSFQPMAMNKEVSKNTDFFNTHNLLQQLVVLTL